MFDPVLDHYRCPSGFFDSEIKGERPPRPDFFQFGNGITCYGRCSNAEVSSSAGRLYLPFDPAEVVDNLRLERYLGAERDRIGFLRKTVLLCAAFYQPCRPASHSKISCAQLAENRLSSLASRYHSRKSL
jgi:hypothetical protein